jgi:hypothetical protein
MAATPGTHTFTGVVATSSEMNSYVRDPLLFLFKVPIAELVATALQSVNNATVTPIAFASFTVDTDVDGVGGHDPVTNNSRYTARYAGWYYCDGAVGWAANATGVRVAWWVVNGAALNNATATIGANAAIVTPPARGKLIFLNIGDYVELAGYQTSGGALNTTNNAPDEASASIHWVSN